MRLLAFAGAAGGVANDPAGRIAARDGNQVLTWLKRDVGDQLWRGIDLKDRPLAEGVDQRAIHETGRRRLDGRARSEERRGGNESISKCRSLWSTVNENKTTPKSTHKQNPYIT